MRFPFRFFCLFSLLFSLLFLSSCVGYSKKDSGIDAHRPAYIDPDNSGFLPAWNVDDPRFAGLINAYYRPVSQGLPPKRAIGEYYKNSAKLGKNKGIEKLQALNFAVLEADTPAVVLGSGDSVFLVSGIDKNSSVYFYQRQYLPSMTFVGEAAFYSDTPPSPFVIKGYGATVGASVVLARHYYDTSMKLYYVELGFLKMGAGASSRAPLPWMIQLNAQAPSGSLDTVTTTTDGGIFITRLEGLYRDASSAQEVLIVKAPSSGRKGAFSYFGVVRATGAEPTTVWNAPALTTNDVVFEVDETSLGGLYFNDSKMPLPLLLKLERYKGYVALILPNGEVRYLLSSADIAVQYFNASPTEKSSNAVNAPDETGSTPVPEPHSLPERTRLPKSQPPLYRTSYADPEGLGLFAFAASIPLIILIILIFI